MDVFLFIALAGLIAAAVNDIRKREVADWISYSLFAVLIAGIMIKSIIEWNFADLLKVISIIAAIYAISSALYYARLLGGGDVKLITAISPVFVFMNIFNYLIFLVVASGIYGLIYSIALALIHRKELKGKLKFNFLPILFSALFLLGIFSGFNILILLSVVILAPYLIIFVSAVEKAALIKLYPADKLTEGDWLTKDIKIKGKLIKATADGMTKKDISIIRKAKAKVWIKEGIPYVPVFLIAFILANLIDLLSIIMAFF